jgi:hypothetical protein
MMRGLRRHLQLLTIQMLLISLVFFQMLLISLVFFLRSQFMFPFYITLLFVSMDKLIRTTTSFLDLVE